MPKAVQAMTGVRGLLVALSLMLGTVTADAAPKSELWPRWTEHNDTSTETVDHSLWSAFLQKFVRSDGSGTVGVAYSTVSATDRQELDDYVAMLEQTPVSELARDEQRSFWINLYNATTVKVVLDAWPVASIRDIKDGLFSGGPWKATRLKVENEDISLNDIEHRILRPIWKDPRLHYALNCASIGCPDLLDTAFTRDNTEQLLEEAARIFINHPRAASVEAGKLSVSSIYHWFKEDFDGSDSGVIAHLRSYAEGELAGALQGIDRLDSHDYDWSINSVAE